jgi:hypothetical protein
MTSIHQHRGAGITDENALYYALPIEYACNNLFTAGNDFGLTLVFHKNEKLK